MSANNSHRNFDESDQSSKTGSEAAHLGEAKRQLLLARRKTLSPNRASVLEQCVHVIQRLEATGR